MVPKRNPSDNTPSCECFINTQGTAPTQCGKSSHTSACSNLPITEEEALATRYSNYYNGYNIDYHNDGSWWQSKRKNDCHDRPFRAQGQTVDGKGTCCHPKPNCECLNAIIDRLKQELCCGHKSSDTNKKSCT